MKSFYERLAGEYGTPLYLYDLDVAAERAGELRALLPSTPETRLHYSFKANPLPSLAGALREAGCEADLTSPGELAAAMAAGFPLERALYGGPGKGREELENAMRAGVRQFSLESWSDLGVTAEAARRLGVKVRGLLRVNPKEPPKAKLAMSGVASQFGFEEEELMAGGGEHLREAADVVSIEGTHIYWGTQIGDAEALLSCFASGLEVAERLSGALGFELRVCNLGGGFPWPYAHHGKGPDLSVLGEGLARLRREAGAAGKAAWWFESGRYLAGSSGTLIARVMDVKTSKGGKRYVILDTGIHHLGGMSGLGRIPRFSMDIDVHAEREGEMTVDVVGQLCTPLDCVARNVTLPCLERGDLVSIPNVGAYGLTGSLIAFLSRPTPLEVAVRAGEVVSVQQLRLDHAVPRVAASPGSQANPNEREGEQR